MDIVKNYLLLAFRGLRKNKIYTVVNIAGLTFGLACSILISLWVWDELTYDKFHEKRTAIFQLFGDRFSDEERLIIPYAPSSLAEPMLSEIPEIVRITRVFPAEVVFHGSEEQYSEQGIYADSSLFHMFSFPLKEGDAKSILKNPYSVVLSQTLSEKYFPMGDALGQTIQIVDYGSDKVDFLVTGILESIPSNSSLQFDFVIAYDLFENKYRPWWKKSNTYSFTNFNVNMYAEFIEGADLGVVNAKLGNFIQEFTNNETSDAIFAFPFDQTYLHSDFSQGRTPTGKIQYVHLFMVIAIIILLIACINFINLSTAVAGKRAREVGLRKVVGALRVQIIFQYLAESILVTLISMVTAMMLLEIFLPFFNVITQKHIVVPYSSMAFMCSLLAVVLLTGILSGAYPAFHLSSFKPAGVLKRSLNPSGISARVRQGLVIAQFTISIAFIVFTIVVFKQIDFVQNKNLGIRKQDIITHQLHGIKGNHAAYRSELLQVPGVRAVSLTEHNPLRTSNGSPGVVWPGKSERSTTYFSVMQVGNGFLGTFDVEIIEGRGFSESVSEGKKYFLINEKAALLMGKSNPVGMDLKVWGQDGTVIGIVKDFHHQTLALEIEPLVIIYSPEEVFTAFIRIESDDHSTVIPRLKEVYSKHEENYTFDYTYVEEQYASDYQDVETVSKLASLFSVAAIIISCLGLFGLSAFMAEQRTREAGIRKVLGATELKLLQLFSAEFIKLVVVSLVIAVPLAMLYSNFWLASYAYRTEVGYMPFVVAGAASLCIAMLTVTYNTLHASSTNPVDSLRHE